MNYLKEEEKKITDQEIIEREKINKHVVRFISVTITLGMLAYTAYMCLQKTNSYHGVIDNPKKTEENVEKSHTK